MQQWWPKELIDPQHIYGTINCDGINAKGENLRGVTTTSGLSWKIPGRRR